MLLFLKRIYQDTRFAFSSASTVTTTIVLTGGSETAAQTGEFPFAIIIYHYHGG